MGFFTETRIKELAMTAAVLLVVLYLISHHVDQSAADTFGLTSHKTE